MSDNPVADDDVNGHKDSTPAKTAIDDSDEDNDGDDIVAVGTPGGILKLIFGAKEPLMVSTSRKEKEEEKAQKEERRCQRQQDADIAPSSSSLEPIPRWPVSNGRSSGVP